MKDVVLKPPIEFWNIDTRFVYHPANLTTISLHDSSTREFGESVLFQPVLKAYPTHHSWLITAHISLGHLEQHWKSFTRQMDRTCQKIQSLN